MKNSSQRRFLATGSIILTIALTGCSATSPSSLTELQCGVISEVQPRIMNLMGKFGSVLLEDVDTRQRAVWDSGYESIRSYLDELEAEAMTLTQIAQEENVSAEDAVVINDLAEAIYNHTYHWVDEDGTEVFNSQSEVTSGQYKILDLCM